MKNQATSWTLIQAAAEGDRGAREAFALRYLPAVRAYLNARWRGRLLPEEIEDSTQEVFVECIKRAGILERVEQGQSAGFRGFLYAACRNVALREERRRARRANHEDRFAQEQPTPDDDPTLGQAFDSAWATAMLGEAAELQAARAKELGAEALRRVELLQLRFQDGLAIGKIAKAWEVDAAWLHHQYAQASKEFEGALCEVIRQHNPGDPTAVARELRELRDLTG